LLGQHPWRVGCFGGNRAPRGSRVRSSSSRVPRLTHSGLTAHRAGAHLGSGSIYEVAITLELIAVSTQLRVFKREIWDSIRQMFRTAQIGWHYQWPIMVMVGKATRGSLLRLQA